MNTYSSQLSKPVRQKISATHFQRAAIWLIAMVLSLFSIAVVLSCLAMLLDWSLSFRQMWIRGLVSLGVVAVFVKAGMWCRSKLAVPTNKSETAGWLDLANPRLEERLTTSVELENRDDCSPELLQVVNQQVSEIPIKGNLPKILSGNRIHYVLGGLAVALLGTSLLYLVCGSNSMLLAERLLMPWSPKTLTQLPNTPLQLQERKGQDLQIAVPITGKVPAQALVQQRDAEGTVEERWVDVDPQSGLIATTFPRIQDDFSYRVIAGDDETPWNDVTVYDYPQISQLSLRVTPPEYTGRPDKVWDTLPRKVTVPEGSRLSLSFAADQPLSAADLIEKSKGKATVQQLVRKNESQFTYSRHLKQSFDAELHLTSALAEITSRFPVSFIVQPDRKPVVQLMDESETFALKADETLAIKFKAIDDYGVERAELVAKLEKEDGSKEEFRFPIELGDQKNQQNIEATVPLDLKQFQMDSGTRLSYQVEVWDRRGEMSQDESQQRTTDEQSRKIADLRQARQRLEDLQQALQKAQDLNNQALATLDAPPVKMRDNEADGEQPEASPNKTSEPNANTESGKENETGSKNPQQHSDKQSEQGQQSKLDSQGKPSKKGAPKNEGRNQPKSNGAKAQPKDQSQQSKNGEQNKDGNQSKDGGSKSQGKEESQRSKASQQNNGGQSTTAAKQEELSAKTQKLLAEAAEAAATLPRLDPKQRGPLKQHIGQAQSEVESAQAAESPAEPLSEAGRQIAKAREAALQAADDLTRQLDKAEAQMAREQKLNELRGALQKARESATRARQMNQAGKSGTSRQENRSGQTGEPSEANSSEKDGNSSQASGKPSSKNQGNSSPSSESQASGKQQGESQSGNQSSGKQGNQSQSSNSQSGNNPSSGNPSEETEKALQDEIESLIQQLEQSGKFAESVPNPDLAPSVKDSIGRAKKAAADSKSGSKDRSERLEEVSRQLDDALAELDKSETDADNQQSPQSSANADVDKRELDLSSSNESNRSSTPSAKVTVDEHEDYLIVGDGQKKKSIEIQKVIDAILKQAKAAKKTLDEVRALDPGERVKEEPDNAKANGEDSQNKFARAFQVKHESMIKSLNEGSKKATELQEVSANTPYAYFGLQAKALVENGFAPAIRLTNEAKEVKAPEELRSQIELIDERLRWVIAFLDKSSKQFQEMIELEEVVSLTHQFRKMHNIMLEDLPLAIGISDKQSGGDKSKYPKLKEELSDQQVQQAIAGLKLKREVLKRLSELLQKNPSLRAKLLVQGQPKKIYREELTRLRNRQNELSGTAFEGLVQEQAAGIPPNGVPQPIDGFSDSLDRMMQRRMIRLDSQATTSLGNARIYIPEDTPDDLRKELENRLSELTTKLERFSQTDFRDPDKLKKSIAELKLAVRNYDAVLDDKRLSIESMEYVEFRKEDLDALRVELETCEELFDSLANQGEDRFLAKFQQELTGETSRTVVDLLFALGKLSGLDEEIDGQIEELEELLTEDLPRSQQDAEDALFEGQRETAAEMQEQASSELLDAVKLLDALLVTYVKVASESEEQNRGAEELVNPLPDPTELQISEALKRTLSKLEKELRELPKPGLGLEAQSNLEIRLDWQKKQKDKEPNEKDDKERREQRQQQAQRRQQQTQQAQKAIRQAAQAQRAANQRAGDLAKGFQNAPTLPWKDRKIQEFKGRNDWNNLPSELKESVTQEFDPSVPPEFRDAIQRYFKTITEANQRK